ncbi:MAG: MFS transporter [Deltaproteobacteria bacterium]|nr:MFS transporter [Deltaproteobacteria bacterium]MBW2360679.1 MFS transporter [Deltaproteobacteria bacterium]
MAETKRLSIRTRAAYGVGGTAEAAISIVFNSFNFLFYNNVLGLSGTLCGLAVTIAMLFDAVSDPLVGSISDRFRSPLGRRHPFLYAAPIPMGIFFIAIYAPPADLERFGLFAWFTGATILLRTAQTLYHVPHLALGAEMTVDYGERSVLMSYNTVFTLIGTAGVSYLAWSYFGTLEAGTSDRTGYLILSSSVALFAILVIFVSAYFTRDQVPLLSQVPADLPRASARALLDEIRTCLTNDNYKALLLGMVFLSSTMGLHETLTSHVGLFFFELREDQIRFLALGAPPGLLLAAILTPKLHVWFDKRETLIAGILGMVTAVAGPIVLRLLGWFPENGAPALFPILCALKGMSYAASAVMVISIVSTLADVTDEHELLTGRRQEGVFFAARSLFSKLTSGLGHLLAGLAIDVIDFPVGVRSGEVDPDTLHNFGVVAGPLTVLPAVISLFFYARYRIDRVRHAEIRRELEARP